MFISFCFRISPADNLQLFFLFTLKPNGIETKAMSDCQVNNKMVSEYAKNNNLFNFCIKLVLKN